MMEKTLEDYRTTQIQFHMEMMKVCRKYINELDIASILGIMDIVKQETIELEHATKHQIRNEEPQEVLQEGLERL